MSARPAIMAPAGESLAVLPFVRGRAFVSPPSDLLLHMTDAPSGHGLNGARSIAVPMTEWARVIHEHERLWAVAHGARELVDADGQLRDGWEGAAYALARDLALLDHGGAR